MFLTFSLVLRILALRRLDPLSFSYISHQPLQNALGICSCMLELMSIPTNTALPTVCDKFHCTGCSFPPRSLPSTFLCSFVQYAKLRGTLLQCLYAIQTSTDVTLQSTDFCQTTTRFDPVLWSPVRQLYLVFSAAVRNCRHQIKDDAKVTQVTV